MFYRLTTDAGKKKRYAYATDFEGWPKEQISCNKCGRQWNKSLMHVWGTEMNLVLTNDYYPDFAWYYITLASDKAKEVIEKEGITGCKFEEANILSVNDLTSEQKKSLRDNGVNLKKIPLDPARYYKMHVSLGAVFHKDSNIVLLESCDECGYEKHVTVGKEWVDSRQQCVLSADSLNGSDLFFAKGYGVSVFCSSRFVDVYNKYKLTGLLFDPVQVV